MWMAGALMGEVALRYRLMSASPGVDTTAVLDSLPTALPDDAKVGAHAVKPFAFGLMAVEVLITGPDRGGFPDDIETALAGLPDIQSVELQEQSLL